MEYVSSLPLPRSKCGYFIIIVNNKKHFIVDSSTIKFVVDNLLVDYSAINRLIGAALYGSLGLYENDPGSRMVVHTLLRVETVEYHDEYDNFQNE